MAVKENFPKRFMIVGAMCARGTFPLIKVDPKAKINSDYYCSHVLTPLVEEYIPRLYAGEVDRVTVHHDKASSHTSRKTTAFMQMLTQKHGIRFLDKDIIPVKGADISPMDFFGFGYIKQKLKGCRATTVQGVWNAWARIWSAVSPEITRKVIESWKQSLRAVARVHGEHIEQTKQIHRRSVHS